MFKEVERKESKPRDWFVSTGPMWHFKALSSGGLMWVKGKTKTPIYRFSAIDYRENLIYVRFAYEDFGEAQLYQAWNQLSETLKVEKVGTRLIYSQSQLSKYRKTWATLDRDGWRLGYDSGRQKRVSAYVRTADTILHYFGRSQLKDLDLHRLAEVAQGGCVKYPINTSVSGDRLMEDAGYYRSKDEFVPYFHR